MNKDLNSGFCCGKTTRGSPCKNPRFRNGKYCRVHANSRFDNLRMTKWKWDK